MANVLLVGSWAPPALAFARSAQRKGLGVYLLQATSQHPLGRFQALRGARVLSGRLVRTAQGLDQITRYAREITATAMVATVDDELLWLAEHRDRFEPACKVLVQPADSLRSLLSKVRQLEWARQVGLPLLPTWLLHGESDAESIPRGDYPVVIRPDRPEAIEPAFKMRFVGCTEQLRTLLRNCRRIGAPIIAQPFRDLPNLVVHGVRSTSGDSIAMRCYNVPRKFEGVTLALEPAAFPEGLEALCRDFANRAAIIGCYHLEFLFSPIDKRAYFLEVNVRLGGTTDKVVRAGFDEPGLLLEAFGVIAPGSSRCQDRVGRVVNKRVVLKHLVHAAGGKLTALDYPHVSRFRDIASSCRDLIAAKDSIFDWRDLSGSVKFHLRS